MKQKLIRATALLATSLAASGAWAALTYQEPGTTTFDSFQDESGYIWVGSTAGAFAGEDAWAIWCSSEVDGVYTNGINQSGTGSGFRIADGDNQTGKLKIESGNYVTGQNNANPWAAFILGNGTGRGSYWQTGGTVTTAKYATRIGNGTGKVDFTLDGGVFTATEWMLIGNGVGSDATATLNGGELNVGAEGGNFPVGYGANSKGTLNIAGGHLRVNVDFIVAGAEGNDPTVANPTGAVYMTSGTITNSSWFVLGRTKGGYNSLLDVSGGEIYSTGALTLGSCVGNGSVATMNLSGGEVNIHNATYILQSWLNAGGGATVNVNVTGGTFTGFEDVSIGGGDADCKAYLNISGTGEFAVGTDSVHKWFKLSAGGSGTSEINLGEGGTLAASHIEHVNANTCVLNFDGGTLKCLYSDNANHKYLIGSQSGTDENFTVTVSEKGGTIDTNGFDVRIKNIAIGGTGTLTITGGGTITFEALPTCPVEVENGVVVCSSTTIPANITLGKNGFLKYDLSDVSATTEGEGEQAVTTMPADQTLAEDVTITLPQGDSVVEHVIIKNDQNLAWTVSYAGTTLSATASLASSTVPSTAIWTGDYTYDWSPQSGWYRKHGFATGNWVGGVPTSATTKTIIPFADTIYLNRNEWLYLGDLYLASSGDVLFYSQGQNHNSPAITPTSVSGNGRLLFGGIGFCTSSSGSPVAINVPVVVQNYKHYAGSGSYTDWNAYVRGGSSSTTINFNDTFTVPADVPCRIEANVCFNSDVAVDGTLEFQNTQTLQGALSGTGTINGSFTTAAGAEIYATVTDATGASTYLTCTGSADLSNAAVVIDGEELLADAADGTAITLFKASSTSSITWTTTTNTIAGADWEIAVMPQTQLVEEVETIYGVLQATKLAATTPDPEPAGFVAEDGKLEATVEFVNSDSLEGDELTAAVVDAAVAANLFTIPTGVTEVDAETYASYFKYTLDDAGEDSYTLTIAGIADTVEAYVDAEAVAALVAGTAGESVEVTVKPGLYYGFSAASNLGDVAAKPTLTLATSTTMTFTKPDSTTQGFTRVVISPTDTYDNE